MKLRSMLLYYSFLQMARMSERKEQFYWNGKINSLGKLEESLNLQQSLFPGKTTATDSLEALENGDVHFFAERLDKKYYYRIAYSFPDDVMFLDIETTGLSTMYHYVTMVGWMINGKYDYWLQGTDPTRFLEAFSSAKMIVTYNGTLFDCKFLDHIFQTDNFSRKPQLDLMYLCRRFGLTDGQKSIERQVGFERPNNLEDVDGKEAIALWYSFLFGDDDALSRLITYNFYDILGMTYILDSVFYDYIYGKEFPKRGRPGRFFSKKTEMRFKPVKPKKGALLSIRQYVKQNISNFSMQNLQCAERFVILGIDLAGKVDSRTGICLLCGRDAKTWVAHTNEDICRIVAQTQPDLISIDAPLSLPKGRNTVYDDDPMREKMGILRYSERVLKTRKVNSYPALIRSMQELTKRGIMLAQLFRKQGYPVIECFPGAAQDVVQLPRKRTDETLLKRGLMELGIQGEYKDTVVCHDELDAITAALVGQFFISGYYEPLGIPEENDMIIPQREYREPKHGVVIGLVGPVATGKTETGNYISSKGYKYIRYSQVIGREMSERGLPVDRNDLREEGLRLFDARGQYHLNRHLAEIVNNDDNVVIDGIRHYEDYTFWKEQRYLNFFLIYIDSAYSVREGRFASRSEESLDYAAAISHEVEAQVGDLKSKADFVVNNNGTLEELFAQVDDIIHIINAKLVGRI